jgi:UDP-GlcNAc:undecaprenyl-phosphate GlcNAc-1-phosphate transferase
MITPVTLVISFVAAALTVILLTPLAIRLAKRFSLFDIPDGRKVHSVPTPLLGGLAVFVGTIGVLLVVGRLIGEPLTSPRLGFLAGAVWMFLLGLADDRYGLSVSLKLVGQFVGAGFLVLTGNTDGLIGTDPVALVLCLIWTVGIVNALNFLDGLDGLAGGTTFIAALAFAVVGMVGGQPYPALLAAIIAGAALGFLRWNWTPARIFLGDAGSLFLGYALASLGLMATWDKASLAYLLVPAIVLGVPIFDITFVVVVRFLEGRAISKPGKDHTSHRVLRLLHSVPNAALVFHAATLLLGSIAIALALLQSHALFVAGALAVAVLFCFVGRRLARVPAA